MSRRLALVLFAVTTLGGGCEGFKRWKAQVRGEVEEGGRAGIRVDVEPADGITILLDGVRVASLSPFVAKNLTAGEHKLEVRAMGYFPIVLPVSLVDGELLEVPVTLRARPDEQPPAPAPSSAHSHPPAPPRQPEGPGPKLPPGVNAIGLTVASEPEAEVRVDGEVVRAKEVELDRARGRLAVGEIVLRYEIGGAGLLTLILPEDGAAWTRDGDPIAAGESFRLHRGAVRLKRQQGDQARAVIIARR